MKRVTTPPLSLLINLVVQDIKKILLGRAIHTVYLYDNTVRSDPYLTEYPLKKLETTFGRSVVRIKRILIQNKTSLAKGFGCVAYDYGY